MSEASMSTRGLAEPRVAVVDDERHIRELLEIGLSDEGYIVRFIKGCAVPTWILPLGTPFSMLNFYNGLPLLSESFRATFSTNYRQIETGRAYQVWKCQLKPLPAVGNLQK